jgi:Xaa-Pro aminopeptidase
MREKQTEMGIETMYSVVGKDVELFNHRLSSIGNKEVPIEIMNPEDSAIKTSQEIDLIQKACSITSEAINHMVENAHSFKDTQQMLKEGCDIIHKYTTDMSYITILSLSGKGKHITKTDIERVHPAFENYSLDYKNPLVLLDIGARYNGYCSDITRTFSTTTPTDRQIDMYRSVLTLYELGESMVKPGVLFSDIDKAVKKQMEVELERLGFAPPYDKFMPHSVGHSIGVEVHDTPSITSVGKLRPNMVLTIEPGIYTDEMDIRIENTIVVTEDGCRVLSNEVPWSMEWFCK